MREARFGLQPLKEWRDGQGVRSSRMNQELPHVQPGF